MHFPFSSNSMRSIPRLLALWATLSGVALVNAQTGPFSPDDWPATRDPAKRVHYVVVDGGLTPPSDNWIADQLLILSGGDQATADTTIGGYAAKKATGNYLNIADQGFETWADQENIDVLVQVYGDGALFNTQGLPRDFVFLTGTLPELNFPHAGQIAVEARNKKWNWHLFRVPNDTRGDGSRFIGSIPEGAQGDTHYGGVNGGTIRFEGVPNLIIRAVAFGEPGAFGEPEDINKYSAADSCDPEPNTNLAGTDLNARTTNHITVLNNNDQTVSYADAIGPAGDKRRAVAPQGEFLNFAITDSYLGKPCNDPRTVKVCLDFYDDPAFLDANVRFGPEAYATDDKGGVNTYDETRRQVMQGTGQWIRRSWTIPAVALKGVNTGTLTGGPRFISENAPVYVSRFEIAVLRAGDHPLAGQDPLANCYEDPAICTDAYGNYVELDLGSDVRNGLDVGSSGGDQEMILAEAGPTGDKRPAIRPAREDGNPGFPHQFLNFAILEEALGPSSQPPAHLAICVTYYDDPALVGQHFKPEVYVTERNGSSTFGFTPDSLFVTLEGTDTWREAYWEIPDVKFNGVNQGPQAAARFVLNDRIFFTRVRYGVIRPCGPNAGVNPLAACKPLTDIRLTATRDADQLVIAWPAAAEGFTLQETAALEQPAWSPVATPPVLQGDQFTVTVTIGGGEKYYRLTK